jgi:uncharacterized membrane protein YgaE (UPF0421/DUF939 family)
MEEEVHVLIRALTQVLLGVIVGIMAVSFVLYGITISELKQDQKDLNMKIEKILEEVSNEGK